MNSEHRSPWLVPTWVLAIAGAALPFLATLKSGGAFFADAGLLKMVWGASPFVLFPLAARLARRGWVRRMVFALTAVAVLSGAIGFLGLLPRRTGSEATLLFVFLPIWQWPVSLLAGVLSVFVPSEEQERGMSGEDAR